MCDAAQIKSNQNEKQKRIYVVTAIPGGDYYNFYINYKLNNHERNRTKNTRPINKSIYLRT